MVEKDKETKLATEARQGKARQDKARQDSARKQVSSKARNGKAGHCRKRQVGKARNNKQ